MEMMLLVLCPIRKKKRPRKWLGDAIRSTILWLLVGLCGCACAAATPKPLPNTVPELMEVVARESVSGFPPLDAIQALGDMGAAAAPAVPVIIPALEYYITVNIAAQALGKIGPEAVPAVPMMITALQTWEHGTSLEAILIRSDLIIALGLIGPPATSAMPVLAQYLDSPYGPIVAAWSMAQITQQSWTDADQRVVYRSGTSRLEDEINLANDSHDESLIVVEAREWWEQTGQYQEWPPLEVSVP